MGGLLVLLSALVALGAMFSLYQSGENEALAAEVMERQKTINGALQLSKFNNQLIRALAGVAAQTNDVQIRTMLAEQGITFEINAPQQSEEEVSSDDDS